MIICPSEDGLTVLAQVNPSPFFKSYPRLILNPAVPLTRPGPSINFRADILQAIPAAVKIPQVGIRSDVFQTAGSTVVIVIGLDIFPTACGVIPRPLI